MTNAFRPFGGMRSAGAPPELRCCLFEANPSMGRYRLVNVGGKCLPTVPCASVQSCPYKAYRVNPQY